MIRRDDYDSINTTNSRREPVLRTSGYAAVMPREPQPDQIRIVPADMSMPNRPYSHCLKGSTAIITKVFCPQCPEAYSLHNNDKCPHCGCTSYKIREDAKEAHPHRAADVTNNNILNTPYVPGNTIGHTVSGGTRGMLIQDEASDIPTEIIRPGNLIHSNGNEWHIQQIDNDRVEVTGPDVSATYSNATIAPTSFTPAFTTAYTSDPLPTPEELDRSIDQLVERREPEL